MSASTLSELTAARYGKTSVRVFRVVREGKLAAYRRIQRGVSVGGARYLPGEYLNRSGNVGAENGVYSSYTEADNSVVVATDSSESIDLATYPTY